ncbi:MAG: M3 family metallopeptidase [Myxococcota bacterium]
MARSRPNPLLPGAAALAFDTVTADDVLPALAEASADVAAVLDSIASPREDAAGLYDATVVPLSRAQARVHAVVAAVHLLDAVASDAPLRSARRRLDAAHAEHQRAVARHPQLGQTLDRLAAATLPTLATRHVAALQREHRRLGALLDVAGRRTLDTTIDALHRCTEAAGAEADSADVREILRLRRRWARTVGYRDFMQLQQDGAMLTTPAAVARFLRDRAASLPGPPSTPAALPDAAHDFFTLPRVQDGLFDLAERLFGVTTVLDPSLPTWHETVVAARLFDGETALGCVYLDLVARPGKRGGPGGWTQGLTATRPGPARAVLCASIAPLHPRARVRPQDTKVLFHEWGHVLHHMLSRVAVDPLAGVRVARDFVEVPAHLIESLGLFPDSLDRFARHYQTGEPMPETLVAGLRAHLQDDAARRARKRIALADVDRVLHTEFDPDGARDPAAVAASVFATHHAGVPEGPEAALRALGPILSHPAGYAAAYYAYPWGASVAESLSARFAAAGGLSRRLGRAFRRTVLQQGASAEPSVLLAAFERSDG